MIKIKSPEEIKIMTEEGRILSEILSCLQKKSLPGQSTLKLDQEAEELIRKSGAKPSFKMVPHYKFATCLCVNEVVVHGLPSDYCLKAGDLLGIDIGLFYKGFHTDAAWTIIVGDQEPGTGKDEKERFLKIGQKALAKAIEASQVGNHIGDISHSIQEAVEGGGYNVVRSLVGHGIGKKLHEDPQVPGFLKGKIQNTPSLREGMILAIEVIYNMGNPAVILKEDGWTIVTDDGKSSGLFEKTIALTKEGPIVLTA